VRWFVYIVILIALVWIVSGCLNRDDASSGTTETNTNETNVNAATNANGNSNVNGSATNRVAALESYDVETACDGVISQSGRDKKLVLTFSGRANGSNVDEIIAALNGSSTPASFFFTGTFAENHADVVEKIAQAGFRVYNQSDSHPDFETLTEDEALQELEQADETISAITKLTTKPFFRPPFGSVDADVTATVKAAGYCPVTWTVDGMDWQAASTAESITTRVQEKIAPGAIILLQVGGIGTTEALPGIINDAKADGYTFVSLPELLGAT
jgi:peptidoglycan/xylan/chitin deacetylase (PgdA/CDA1 family)